MKLTKNYLFINPIIYIYIYIYIHTHTGTLVIEWYKSNNSEFNQKIWVRNDIKRSDREAPVPFITITFRFSLTQ